MQGYFHPVAGIDRREAIAANTRAFVGDGSPYLKVPGLLDVRGVRIQHAEIPLTETRDFPTDHTHTRIESATFSTIALQHAQDGTPILLRSMTSNDGLWQKDETVYVTGDWDDAVPAPEAPAPRKGKGTVFHEVAAEKAD